MEQEISSIIKYIMSVIDEGIECLIHKIPMNFNKPSIYFPVPEFRTNLSSTSCYEVSYMWLIKVFAPDDLQAYSIASDIVLGIASNRYLIPLLNDDGTKTEKSFTIYEPRISKVDNGVYTIEIDWDSIRLYTEKEVMKMRKHFENYFIIRR
ncbi:MAG: hypothetical protein Q4D26_09680 [Clostridia bacterium]|nr:hypothetical protein [Clostridia bacterium]